MRLPWLSVTLFLPLVGAAACGLVPRRWERASWGGALVATVATFVASVGILVNFQARAGFQLTERVAWVREWGISYHLGVDGISLWLILLTTFIFVPCVLVSWTVSHRAKEMAILLLVTEWAILGAFMALDLLLFYVFWEGMLIPMYLLIGIWGYERRIYATIKFFLYTLAGGLLMLVAIIFIHLRTPQVVGGRSFAYQDFLRTAASLGPGAQRWLFAAFAVAFAIKVPTFPFHTWLPDAHTEAPTAGSVILAGVLLKLGTYGLLRFAVPFFPDVAREAVPYLAAAAVVGILYGAAVCAVQSDLKRLVAYSSISHLGFVVLGLFSFTVQGMQGATLQMVNHGLSTGALFLLVGMLYDRRHSRQIADFGGLAAVMPVYAGVFLVVALSSLGLPGLNGFVGEFLILVGTFRTHRLAAVLATGGVVLAALYLLWAYQRTFHGPVTSEENRVLKDLSLREKLTLYPVVAAIVAIGVWPQPFLSRIQPAVSSVLAGVR